ncbi:Oligopeptide transport ATP-binding protein OppF [Streptomyces sp. YIM 130001]|uniref:ABC transporter ATP-binding protein n=1 Tax=Streptomyces sp. YIM 130001 TaxID=2259644 RepID=UPI000E65C67A|nr:ABC transporter ATP-binding protein [Streptomyces sp. YIM 130001]RII14220.1 Oligopeptide transport ATP-binding protein OppF [Streptomyces sp. YIM 130001]
MSRLVFDGVSVRYGHGRQALTAVDGASLTVPSGQVVGLVGESGSGKSTLARSAVGLAPVGAGRVLLDDTDVTRLRGRHRPLQMIFQDPYASLDPRMTIGDSIAEAIPRHAVRGRAGRRAEVARLLDQVNLDPDRAAMLPSRLSGGQRQRVGIARALAGRPEVVIADEITSALDVSVQGTVLNLFREVQRRLNLTTLFITHNLAVVRHVSDHIAVMHLGRIVESGPTDEILANPRHPYTRELLAAVPRRAAASPGGGDPGAQQLVSAEPADPHHPPGGCRYHLHCPVGPLVRDDRELCRSRDPGADAESRPHRAACHFVSTPSLISAPPGKAS